MSNLNLKALAKELDDLREMKEEMEESGKLNDYFDSDRFQDLESLEHVLGDLHIASREKNLIHEDDWREYAQTLADDIYDLRNMGTLANYIDWDAWADDLQSDYSCVDFEDETYYYQD